MGKQFAPEYAWIKRGARARLKVRLPQGVPAGTTGSVKGTPDSYLKVPINFGRSYGEYLVHVTQIERA